MDNQFINAPLLVNRSQTYVDPKDELIKGLELKNTKLKTELRKIQRAMQEKFEGMQQQEGPRKRESIFQSQDNFQVLNSELANTYKRIKMYEYEIGKLEDSNRNVNVSQKTTQIELIIKEKKSMGEKLKQQYIKEQKLVQENIRKLGNNNQKEELEVYMRKLNQEAKFYKEKVKYFEQNQTMKAAQMKKQYEAIKKLENQLLETGFAAGELEEIKRGAIRSLNVNFVKQHNEEAKTKQQAERLKKEEDYGSGSEQEVQDRTREYYQSLLADIALYEKMQNDHERQSAQAEQDKQQAIRRNMNSRNKLIECENEIENLQKEILIIKNRVVPSNMKPLKPLRSASSHQGENPQKLMPAKSMLAGIKNKGLAHLLKYDEVGLPSNKGQRFTDRNVLGKNKLSTRIIGIKIYMDKSSSLIAGIQCTYAGNKRGGQYVRKDKDQKEKQYNQEQFTCKGSGFIRTISGTLNPEDRLESLVFTSSDGSSMKVGNPRTTQKRFNLDISEYEYPVCVFGSLLICKQPGKKESSLIEHIGFQIQSDNAGSHSVLVNEFND